MYFFALALTLANPVFDHSSKSRPHADVLQVAIRELKPADLTDRPNAKLENVLRLIAKRAQRVNGLEFDRLQTAITSMAAELPHTLPSDCGTIDVSSTADHDRKIIVVRIGLVSSLFVFAEDATQIGTPVPLDWSYGFELKPVALNDGLAIRAHSFAGAGKIEDTQLWFAPRSMRGYAISRRFSGKWPSDAHLGDWMTVGDGVVTFRSIVDLGVLAFRPANYPVLMTQTLVASASRPRPIERKFTNNQLRLVDEYLQDARIAPIKSAMQAKVLGSFRQPTVLLDRWAIARDGIGHSVVEIDTADEKLKFVVTQRKITAFEAAKRKFGE